MTVVADGIDLGASDGERYRHLKWIIENVLTDTDPDMSEARRQWIIWLFLYICWWEGSRATTRTQTGGGPGRGLMQFEPATLEGLIRHYVLGPTSGLVANLAAAAGVSPDEMDGALRAFLGSSAGTNVWPNPTNPGPAKKIEEWLTTLDSFGIKLMRYQFKRTSQHRFPPQDPNDEGKNPQDDRFKGEFSEQWAEWWKRLFTGNETETPEEERARKKREFEERARALDRTAAGAPPATPTPGPTPPPAPPPTPSTPGPPPTPTTPPAPPSPPGGTGPCPFVIALGPESNDVAALRQFRSMLGRSASGRSVARLYYFIRPTLIRWISTSPPAHLAFRFTAGRLATMTRLGLAVRHSGT